MVERETHYGDFYECKEKHDFRVLSRVRRSVRMSRSAERFCLSCAGLLCILCFVSCCGRRSVADDPENSNVKIINVSAVSEENIDPYLYDVSFLVLKDRDNPVGQIRKMRVWGDEIYLSDKDHIFVYDTSGNFRRRLGSRGRAENEYVSLSGFEIDKRHGEVVVSDYMGQKIVIYSAAGNFLRKIKAPQYYSIEEVSRFNDTEYLVMNEAYDLKVYNAPRIMVLDEYGRTARIFRGGIASRASSRMINNVVYNGDYVSVMPQYCDTVYSFDGYSLNAEYVLSYESGPRDYKKIESMKEATDMIEFSREYDGQYTNGIHALTDSILYVKIGRNKHLFYDINSSRPILLENWTLGVNGAVTADESGAFWGVVFHSEHANSGASDISARAIVASTDNTVLIRYRIKPLD